MIFTDLVAAVAVSLPLAVLTSALATPGYVPVVLHLPGDVRSFGTGIGNGQVVGYSLPGDGTGFHALVWPLSSPQAPTDLTPTTGGADILATDGFQQVGSLYTGSPGGSTNHAALWTGSAGSVTDLHPAEYVLTVAHGVGGGQQVGTGIRADASGVRAMLWSGTAESAVELHPMGYTHSVARGTNGTHQVGWGQTRTGNHALLWSGTAESAVALDRQGASDAEAYAISDDQIVGRMLVGDQVHAVAWNGLGTRVVDLNPPWSVQSVALATSGTFQAGHAAGRAVVWRGSAETAIDLHLLLPPEYTSSEAHGVDTHGNVVGRAYDAVAGQHRAVLWVIPEPAGMAVVVVGTLLLLGRPIRRACGATARCVTL